MNKNLIFALLFSLTPSAFGKDIKIATYREDIKPYVRAANVWNRPPWISEDLRFISSPDLIRGPEAKGYTKLLVNGRRGFNEVFCEMNEKDARKDSNGKTPKFNCQIQERTARGLIGMTDDDGDRRTIKVKYSPPGTLNNEIYGEVLGTRLLWALGFGADQMFFIDRLNCTNCPDDPWKDRKLAPGNRVSFAPVVIEKKISGDELLSPEMVTENRESKKVWNSGIKFREMMENLPTDPRRRAEQLERRDALRLLAAFMQHVDLKNENQRFVCRKYNERKQCTSYFMVIQDIGSSFGVQLKGVKFDKVHLETWRDTPIWRNPRKCKAQTTENPVFRAGISGIDSSMDSIEVSEAGRRFLAKLLNGFAADRERVRDLFRAAHIEDRGRGESIEDWVDAFMSRVRQIDNPTGERGFRCPPSPYET